MKLTCAVCREPIKPGPYKRDKGKNYHLSCYKKHIQPHCSLCGKPIAADYIQHEEKNYHRRCFTENLAVKCSLCGRIIQGRYTKDYWGNTYHAIHLKQHSPCEYCGRLIHPRITGGGKKYRDGRQICNLCAKKTISAESEAAGLLERTQTQLARYGIETDYQHTLSLAGSRELCRQAGREKINHNHLGFTRQEKRYVNNKLTAIKFSIFILSGLPEAHYISTAAHELMHLWQYIHVRKKLSAAESEGSCNYAAYLILKKRRDEAAAYLIHTMLTSTNRIYGRGFQKIHTLVKARGIPYWLNSLKKP